MVTGLGRSRSPSDRSSRGGGPRLRRLARLLLEAREPRRLHRVHESPARGQGRPGHARHHRGAGGGGAARAAGRSLLEERGLVGPAGSADPYTTIRADSSFENFTHLGTEYAALVVDPGYRPPQRTDSLPAPGDGVVAVVVARGGTATGSVHTTLSFGGHEWIVRGAPSDRGGRNEYDTGTPGPTTRERCTAHRSRGRRLDVRRGRPDATAGLRNLCLRRARRRPTWSRPPSSASSPGRVPRSTRTTARWTSRSAVGEIPPPRTRST